MLSIERNIPYYTWLSFLTAQNDKCRKIIYALKKFDANEWLLIFEMWYYFEILNKFRIESGFQSLNESTFDVSFTHFDTWQDSKDSQD